MRGNFPNVPAQMEVLPFAGRHGENISIQRQKERKRVKKRCFGNGPKVLFLTLSFFCFVSFCKCRYQRERPGVIQDRFMGLRRGYFYICKNRGKAAGPHSVPLYGHTALARRRGCCGTRSFEQGERTLEGRMPGAGSGRMLSLQEKIPYRIPGAPGIR